jgi:PKD repeat protein
VWDFGDGGSASGATVGHVFARPGTYTVRLTARGAGGSASVEHSVTVAPRPPRAAFAYLPARPVPGRPMGFIADTVPVAGGAPLASYAWDFGDGTTASGPREGHVYLSSGSFRVTLTVTDTAGQTATAAMAVAVAAADAPSAMFVYEPAPVGAGADTTFAGVAIRRAGTWAATKLVGWSWSFGDGTTASGQQAHHVFARPGSYRVQLTVTDASGAAGTVASTVVVKTNVVAVDETVSVADTDTAALPPSIAVLEPIVVSDAPGLVPPASLDVTESVGVSDVPGIVPPAVVVDDESWGFTDSTVTAVHH